jgi:hypothetical protein
MWMDFGINHVAWNPEKIHEWILRIPDKIKQLCINPYVEHCDPKYFFQYIYHHTAGGLFSGNRDHLRKYVAFFKEKITEIYQDNWYQIDEAVMTMVQRDHPELFDFYYGDYQGIISNYLKPVHNYELILQGLEKTRQYNCHEFASHIVNYISA